MFSAEASPARIIGRQFLYKLKAQSFFGLILMHIIVLFFSANGSGAFSSGSSDFVITVKNYAGDLVILSTLIWIFIMAFFYTKNQHKNLDFTLVTNRVSSCLSDIGLLTTLCLAGGITASLSGMLLRFVLYNITPGSLVLESTFKLPPNEILTGIAANIFYLLLICSIGYLFGMLIEIHKIFSIIVPALLLGLARTQDKFFLAAVKFFTGEPSLLLFSGKVILISTIFFALSILLYNRMEVRQ